MKTSQKFISAAFALSLVTVIGAGSVSAFQGSWGQGHRQGQGQRQEVAPLTESEKTMLIYGQQEERLARDVYKELGEKYELETFEKISGSENRHMESVGRILENNNIPQTTGYGELQETFDALINKGDISLKDAIEVGITIEILDIKDLDTSLAKTNNEQIIRVYKKLREGSIKHLNAYVAQLQKNGYTTDLNWQQYTNQEAVTEKIKCFNLSPEERAKKEKEKHANHEKREEHEERAERGEKHEEKGKHEGREHKGEKHNYRDWDNNSEKNSDKVRGQENGNGREEHREARGQNDEYDNYNKEQRDSEMRSNQREDRSHHGVKKARKYHKFSGKLKEKKHFRDAEKIKHKKAVEFLQQRGILDGYANGSFQPENPINRAESIKVLLESLGQAPSSGELGRDFSDVKKDVWFAGYVKKAKEHKIVKGYADGTFRPMQTVNQAELLKIAFESFGLELSDYAITTLPNGTDTNAWYAQYLQYALDNNLLDDENVNPEKGMTRDEFSELIYRLIQQQEAL